MSYFPVKSKTYELVFTSQGIVTKSLDKVATNIRTSNCLFSYISSVLNQPQTISYCVLRRDCVEVP